MKVTVWKINKENGGSINYLPVTEMIMKKIKVGKRGQLILTEFDGKKIVFNKTEWTGYLSYPTKR